MLTVSPGDTIHTTTVDAGGTDEKGVRRVLGGNPETGPFYIETAGPGDVLVVHLTRLRLNRDWAISDDTVVGRGLDSGLAVKMKDAGKSVRWHLDREGGVATPEKPAEHLTGYSVPLRPMLGCVATASSVALAGPPSADSGRFGGNMDFNEVIEGATLYLPVNVPGALLYLGDDIRMIQRRSRPRFLQEPALTFRIGGLVAWQGLDGDGPVQAVVSFEVECCD